MIEKESALRLCEDPPVSIVGIPEDFLEADLAKSKFAETISFLKQIVPEIEEARCKMKLTHTADKKNYYEDVSIVTPHKINAYANSGWDLKMFDEMSESLRKRFEQEKHRRHGRGTARHE